MLMKVVSFLSLTAVAVSTKNLRTSEDDTTATTSTTYPPNGCYTNTDDIYKAISDDSKLDELKRFVVCPNTKINLGFLVPGVGIDKGQSPLIPRSNTEFLCGEDGSSKNDCVLLGGDFGVIAVPVFFRQDIKVTNVKISGFTFTGQVQCGVFAAVEGDITFNDCIFKDSANYGTMVFNYDSKLDFGPPDEEDADNGTFLNVTIKDAVFHNLDQVQDKLGVEPGIVTIKGPDHIVEMKNNIFSSNHYSNENLTTIGYGVLAQEASVILKNNCFIDNEVRGNAPVLIELRDGTRDSSRAENYYVHMAGNYATKVDQDRLDCQFAAVIDTASEAFDCIPVETKQCAIPWYIRNCALCARERMEIKQSRKDLNSLSNSCNEIYGACRHIESEDEPTVAWRHLMRPNSAGCGQRQGKAS